MNVSAIQAMPNNAIAATMPADSNGWSSTFAGSMCPTSRMISATVNIASSITIVMLNGAAVLAGTHVGRRLSNKPMRTITATPARKMSAERRPPGRTGCVAAVLRRAVAGLVTSLLAVSPESSAVSVRSRLRPVCRYERRLQPVLPCGSRRAASP